MVIGAAYVYLAHVERIVDGDTLAISVDLGFFAELHIRVRVKGIDTPEINGKTPAEQEHAAAAKAFVESQLPPGALIQITSFKPAVYNRWEAIVLYLRDGVVRNLAEELVANGFEKRATY